MKAVPFSETPIPAPKKLTNKEKRKLACILRRDLHLSAKHVNVTGAFAAYAVGALMITVLEWESGVWNGPRGEALYL